MESGTCFYWSNFAHSSQLGFENSGSQEYFASPAEESWWKLFTSGGRDSQRAQFTGASKSVWCAGGWPVITPAEACAHQLLTPCEIWEVPIQAKHLEQVSQVWRGLGLKWLCFIIREGNSGASQGRCDLSSNILYSLTFVSRGVTGI